MKRISLWAWHHQGKARLAVLFLHLLLAALAIYIGSTLSSMSLQISSWVLLCGMGIFLAAATAYPDGTRIRYWRQKTCDLLLAAAGFLALCSLSNLDNLFGLAAPLASGHKAEIEWARPGATKPTAGEILASLHSDGKRALTRQEKRVLRKEFRRQVKIYIKAKATGDKHAAEKALLIIASIVAAIGLLYLLAGLACEISCSGSTGLAIFVFFTGFAAVIFGLVFLIRAILRWGKPKALPGPQLNSFSSIP
ncbi:MAG: hypothetical protein Q8927_17855 [Bacteroidota bacterium]|nr:hypothetical protein [Bacteroidota bacterium]MDP4244865.1 hypothetical protein [Bacteroidota bacterium]MDP4260470.1 hypothetical protein [Bacteroidota bacterium]